MAKVEFKLEGVDEVEKPKLVMRVPQLKLDLLILGRLTEDQFLPPPQRQLREQIQAVDYLMGYISVLGFVSVLWGQVKWFLNQGCLLPCIKVDLQTFGNEII